jgi:hypothetical protein
MNNIFTLGIYPPYFKLLGCWLHLFTLVTELGMFLGITSLITEVHPAGQRKRCSSRFMTDLSFVCRLQATRIILSVSHPLIYCTAYFSVEVILLNLDVISLFNTRLYS